MKPVSRLRSRIALGVLLLVVLSVTSCKSWAVQQDFPLMTPPAGAPSADLPTADVTFEFRSNGSPLSAVTNAYRPAAVNAVQASGAYSAVRNGGVDGDVHVHVEVDNVYGSLVGPIFKGFVTGLTLYLIGNNTTDDYDIVVSFTPKGGTADEVRVRSGVTSSSGLLRFPAGGVYDAESSNEAFTKMLEQAVLRAVQQHVGP